MGSLFPHSWLFPDSLLEAKRAQEEIANRVLLQDIIGEEPSLSIAGMDVSNRLYDPAKMIFGSAVLLSTPTMQVIEVSSAAEKQDRFPYIPGFLGFREAPVLFSAFQGLALNPDLLIVDGHGIAHPRKCGIASHIGVLLDIPTIGVAKNILIGTPQQPLSEEKGSRTPLIWRDEIVGMLVRTKRGVKPLIISVGHKTTLDRAVKIVLDCVQKYRLPEPTRMAHNEANQFRRLYQQP